MPYQLFKNAIWPIKDKLYRFAYKMLGNEEDAKDMLQEVLKKIWEQKEQINTINNIEAWCIQIVKNTVLDKLKKNVGQTVSIDNIHVNSIATNVTPYQKLAIRDIVSKINVMIQELPIKYKMVIQLREIEEFSYEEIATALNMNINEVKVNLFRARKAIAEKLNYIHIYEL